MFQGLGNLASLMKQAQQMRGRLESLNETLRQQRAVGQSGGGMVEAEFSGLQELLRLKIDPSLFAQNDRELIEDLVTAAVNQGLLKSRQLHADAMKELTGGLSIPGLDEAFARLTGSPDTT